MTNDEYRSQFRFPTPLYLKLLEELKTSGRSLNAEVVWRLEQSFRADPSRAIVDAVAEAKTEIIEEIRRARD